VVALYAHRGASAELPENTIAAFSRAIELGATAIETDAQLTKDGHVVLSHDETGARAAGVPRRIAESTLEEVRTWNVASRHALGSTFTMPTLEEALAAVPDAPFNVDCKPKGPRAAEVVVGAVRRARAQARVRIASFETRTLRHVRHLGYEGETGLGQSEIAVLALAPMAWLRAFPLGGSAAQVPVRAMGVRLDTRRFVDRCHALGLVVHYWTVDEPREALRLAALGADGLMTDDPRAIAPVLRPSPRAPAEP
jgi:glycerophosphoryl diester phosphodiesterase